MEKRINAIPVVTAAVLAVAILALIGWQGLRMRENVSATPQAVARDNASTDSSRERDAAPPQLEQLAFFGTAGDQTDEPVERAETLPETNLQLVLRGVMAGDTDETDSALVEGPDGETKVYRIGDALPGNASLREVRQRRIVIERAGALETLTFPENEGNRLALGSNQRSSPNNSDSDATEGAAPSADRSSDVRSRLNKLRERLSN
ncbi:type II secretion system protein N [Salicola sp. Rm-C-2C1-2]|uniref:type II secretion system protein N n=1 Tax=Salicola sp. Rm-C-2C1-2 TaxID=3141321 RepID=UPI0032E4E7E6